VNLINGNANNTVDINFIYNSPASQKEEAKVISIFSKERVLQAA